MALSIRQNEILDLARSEGRVLVEDLARGGTLWIEPVWKMIWSNKGVLAVLWELFPEHPNLLAAGFDIPDGDAVAKPLLAREGANVSIRRGGRIVAEAAGDYGDEGYVYQAIYRLPEPAPGCFPVIGSWVVDGEPEIISDPPLLVPARELVPDDRRHELEERLIEMLAARSTKHACSPTASSTSSKRCAAATALETAISARSSASSGRSGRMRGSSVVVSGPASWPGTSPRSSTRSSAATVVGQNCVPAWRSSSTRRCSSGSGS